MSETTVITTTIIDAALFIVPATPKGLTDRHLRQAALFAVAQLTSALRGERYMTRAEVDTAEGILREWFSRSSAVMIERDRERREDV